MCLSAPVPKQGHKKPKSAERGEIFYGYSSENYRNSPSKAKKSKWRNSQLNLSLFLFCLGFFFTCIGAEILLKEHLSK